MFQASLCPSSGALDIMLLRVVFSTRCVGWRFGEPGSRPCAHIKDSRSHERQIHSELRWKYRRHI